MVDLFIVFLTFIIAFQIIYRIVVGDDFPKNAFYSGVMAPIGTIVFTGYF